MVKGDVPDGCRAEKGSVRDADEDGQCLGRTRPKRVHRQWIFVL